MAKTSPSSVCDLHDPTTATHENTSVVAEIFVDQDGKRKAFDVCQHCLEQELGMLSKLLSLLGHHGRRLEPTPKPKEGEPRS